MPPRSCPPSLEEEHVEEILLRIRPHQPAGLFRAALVCKRWCRLISSAAFRRRYRDFHHRRPPLLALLSNGVADGPDGDYGSTHESRFLPLPRTALCFTLPAVSRDVRALDARHGRVLLQRVEEEEEEDGTRHGRNRNPFALLHGILFQRVGAPVNGARGLVVRQERREVPVPIPAEGLRTLGAAVLCSDTTGACDHLDCHRGGPFLVVLVACRSANVLVYTYSSQTATWNDPISTRCPISTARLLPSAYVGNALYFGFRKLNSILKYDLQLGQISWIPLPTMCTYEYQRAKVFTTNAGVLGLATIRDSSNLHIWSRKDHAPQVDDAGWTQTKVIDLRALLTVEDLLALREPQVVGFADGIPVIFIWANGVVYGIDLKTCKKIRICSSRTIYTLIPYTSFCTPALGAACTGEGPSADGSSA